MSRRRKHDEYTVSLFPFLSILACVIGVLTLMITALALGQMDERPDPEALARADELDTLNARASARVSEKQRVNDQIQKASSVRTELNLRLEELIALQQQLKELQEKSLASLDLKTKLQAEIELLKQRIAELEPELAQMIEALEKFRAELAEREKPPPEAVVTIRSIGSGRNLDAEYVECRKNGIVILGTSEQTFVRLADLNQDQQFLGLLDRVSKKPQGTVIFLMRSDAIATYYRARDIARRRYCRNGKLPVVGQGKLDLSRLKRKT